MGSCTTEYGWINNSVDPTRDIYHLWNNASIPFEVPITRDTIQEAPKVSFIPHPDAADQYIHDGNTSFAIVIWSAHRASIKQGGDPWYKTEDRNASFKAPFKAPFWIMRARPVLSCWQKDSWRYGSKSVTNIAELKHLPGIKIKPVLLNVLQSALSYPVLMSLGTASGDSALKSRSTSLNGVINAEVSNIVDDLERLILASFAFTRNVFLDTTMHQESGGLSNLMLDGSRQPADGAGDFAVSSPNFQTFSMVGLIIVFVVLVALWATRFILHTILFLHTAEETKRSKLMLFRALPAVQLFRRIYEQPTEIGEQNSNWPCGQHFPKSNDGTTFKMVECKDIKTNGHCKGHINGKPDESVIIVDVPVHPPAK
ncbi:hypothetical protein V8C42DRAFT_322847 [Trichoderma barbatum]